MRFQHWLKGLGSSMTLLTAATISYAQGPGSPVAYDDGSSGGAEIVDDFGPNGGYPAGAPTGPSYGGPPPGAYGGPQPGPGGAPGANFQQPFHTHHQAAVYPPQSPGFAPWPAISPFEPANLDTDRHMNRRGLWFRDMMFQNQEVEFSAEYIYTQFSKQENSVVGSPIPQFIVTADGTVDILSALPYQPNVPLEGAQFVLNNVRVGRGVYPFVYHLLPSGAVEVVTDDISAVPPRFLSNLGGRLDSNGMKMRMGVRDSDGSGWGLSGYFAPEGRTSFQAGSNIFNGVPITQAMVNANIGLIRPRNGSLPLNDGVTIPPDQLASGFVGTSQKFDLMYRMNTSTSSEGVGLNHYMTHLIEGEAMSITPMYGARYMHIGDEFHFLGVDSGLGYDVDDSEDGNEPTGAILLENPLMETVLNNTVDSHLAGPQAGFRVDLGNTRNFKVWGETTFGLMINHERYHLDGQNVGVPLFHQDDVDGIPEPDEMFDITNDRFRTEITSFDTVESTTHVSPLFEQSIQAESALSNLIPGLGKNALLENANLKVGYTFTAVGVASRAGNTVNWRGFPQFPGIKQNHETFLMHQFNLGLNWMY